MAHEAHQLIGSYRCWCCAKETPVKKTKGGKVVAECLWCDFKQYALPGTIHQRKLMAQVDVTKIPAEEPA